MKDHERAAWAYSRAREASQCGELDEYENAVQTFAAATLRSGLAVAASVLEREKNRPGWRRLLTDLAARDFPGLGTAQSNQWPSRTRELGDAAAYMLATREILAVAAWLRRACRALG